MDHDSLNAIVAYAAERLECLIIAEEKSASSKSPAETRKHRKKERRKRQSFQLAIEALENSGSRIKIKTQRIYELEGESKKIVEQVWEYKFGRESKAFIFVSVLIKDKEVFPHVVWIKTTCSENEDTEFTREDKLFLKKHEIDPNPQSH